MSATLCLGTVQWGLPYGISNDNGQTLPDEVGLILSRARCSGIDLLDTASLYGNAESVLGGNDLSGFRIITKTPNLGNKLSTEQKLSLLQSAFYNSKKNLSVDKVYGLLVHNADDILASDGFQIINKMKEIQSRGLVRKLGVSVYDEQQLDSVLKVFKPDIVQLPLNVLDQRFLLSGQLGRLQDLGVEIHVRSVFLQGLLLTPLDNINGFFEPIKDLLSKWHIRAADENLSLLQAALSFVSSLPEVDAVLVGVENAEQLEECIQGFLVNKLFDSSDLGCSKEAFINPTKWEIH